jgi:hypothetical protein
MDAIEKMFQVKSVQTEILYVAGAHVSKDGKQVSTMNIFCRLDGQDVVLVVDSATKQIHKLLFSNGGEFQAMLRAFMKEGCLNLGNLGKTH